MKDHSLIPKLNDELGTRHECVLEIWWFGSLPMQYYVANSKSAILPYIRTYGDPLSNSQFKSANIFAMVILGLTTKSTNLFGYTVDNTVSDEVYNIIIIHSHRSGLVGTSLEETPLKPPL